MGKYLTKKFFVTGVFFIILMIIFKLYYRPWIYSNHFFDFYLADTYTNLFGECVTFFIVLSFTINYKYKAMKILISTSLGLILYELATGYLGGICDYKDIIATCLGGAIAFAIYSIQQTRI